MRTIVAPLCYGCATGSHDNCRGCLCDHDDPTVMAAQALALTMAQYRQITPDATYAMALKHFEALAKMLPDGVEVDTSGH